MQSAQPLPSVMSRSSGSAQPGQGEREVRRCDGLYWLKSRGVLPLTSQTGMTLHTVTENNQSGNTVGLVPPPRTNHVSRAAGRGTAVTARGGRSHPAGRPGTRRGGGARCRAGWARSQHRETTRGTFVTYPQAARATCCCYHSHATVLVVSFIV